MDIFRGVWQTLKVGEQPPFGERYIGYRAGEGDEVTRLRGSRSLWRLGNEQEQEQEGGVVGARMDALGHGTGLL